MMKTKIALFFSFAAIIFSYYFVDQPVALWAYHHNLRQLKIFDLLTHIVDVICFFTFSAFVIVCIRFYLKKYSHYDAKVMYVITSVVLATFLKDVLKTFFSRYWPATWTNDNLSFLHDHVYGFKWFHGGPSFASFPSGHIAITTAAMISLSLIFPRLRYLAFFIICLVAISLIGAYYHFVSDVIGGMVLGYFVAVFLFQFNSVEDV